MESLNALEIRVYKDDKNKLITIPINQKVLTFDKVSKKLKIDENKLNDLLISKGITNKNYVLINEGTIFINKDDNLMYYSNGGGTLNKNILEIKSLTAKNELVGSRKNRYLIPISSLAEKFCIAQVDELGKIYNKKTFDELLK